MNKYFFLFALVLTLYSCTSEKKTSVQSQKDSVGVNESASVAQGDSVGIATTWIDDFKDFRQALYDKNTTKLKTYFSFPLSGEGSSIWQIFELTETERKQRNKEVDNPELFYERDFDRYYTRVFDAKFLNGVLKLKSAELFAKGMAETKEFPDAETPYKMYASFDKQLNTLQLNLAFHNNATDENGEYVSEGEYNVIYFFDVMNGKNLRFKKVLMAG